MANPSDVVGADIEINDGSLALIVSDREVGEWPLDDVDIEVEMDGFHMLVDGEEFVFTTTQAAAFAAAVGVVRRPEPAAQTSAKVGRVARPPKSQKASKPKQAAKAPRALWRRTRSVLARIDLSSSSTRIAAIAILVSVLLAVFARPTFSYRPGRWSIRCWRRACPRICQPADCCWWRWLWQ
jgi:hypothetical protein